LFAQNFITLFSSTLRAPQVTKNLAPTTFFLQEHQNSMKPSDVIKT